MYLRMAPILGRDEQAPFFYETQRQDKKRVLILSIIEIIHCIGLPEACFRPLHSLLRAAAHPASRSGDLAYFSGPTTQFDKQNKSFSTL